MRAFPALAVVVLAASSLAAAEVEPRVHAIVGARIVIAPGQVLERGTIVLRDGLIVAVGPGVAVPADARRWEGEGLTVYPGLIDAFVTPAAPPSPAPGAASAPLRAEPAPPAGSRGAAHALASVTPDRRVVESAPLAKDQVEGLRAAGFAVAQVAPAKGIFRGQSAVVALSGAAVNQSVVRADAAQVVAFTPERQGYPDSLMGAVAVVRQAFRDAAWYRDSVAAQARAPERADRPEANLAWAALQPVLARKQPVLFVADEMLEILRAGAVAKEAGVTAQIVGAGDEYKRVKEIAALGLPLIVPVSFLEAPDVSDPDDALEVGIEELRHFDQGPGNPAALSHAGVTFALTTSGLKDAKGFRANVARAIERGLEPDRALAAVTTVPARLLGLENRLGTLAVGKAANLTVTRGDLFAAKSRVREVWVDGQRFEVALKDEPGAKGRFDLAWSGTQGTLTVAQDKEPTARVAIGGETIGATEVRLDGPRLSFTLVRGGQTERFDLTERRDRLTGSVLTGNGIAAVTGVRSGEAEPDKPKEGEKTAEAAKPDPKPVETPVVMGNSEPWRMAVPEAPAILLVKNATIWTAGPQGTLAGADLLVKAGKIAAVGQGLTAPPGAVIVEATGRHVAPGIIDAHSHSAILGNVNECTNSVTAEVRVEDAVNSESVNIYRQLAGGTTVMHLLHGSCNAIGGQSALIKNKWGEPPDRLRLAGAPPTIKFALGENPKRSYSAGFGGPEPRRYPATRAGVEQVIREAFTKARDYRDGSADFRAGRRLVAPRPDLQAEALVEVLDGKRLIHSHSYRQDEILMLMRLTEEFGIHVQTFQHILEGYKVADEMAKHGASGSAFSDWWAYKFEVIDAIPYNGFLMWDRGVTVSYNSDSDELARILNVEAGKAMKYGGVPPEEAIRFVTLNPAKQLKIDDRVGSLEVGKDADFSIRTESPLSPASRVQETWIEGRKYFDRDADLAGRAVLAQEREALVAKARAARKAKPPEAGGNNRQWPPRYLDDTDDSDHDCGNALPAGEVRR